MCWSSGESDRVLDSDRAAFPNGIRLLVGEGHHHPGEETAQRDDCLPLTHRWVLVGRQLQYTLEHNKPDIYALDSRHQLALSDETGVGLAHEIKDCGIIAWHRRLPAPGN